MTFGGIISLLRKYRNYLEYRVRSCMSLDKKQDLLWKIEKINIFIQDFGEDAYDRKQVKPNKF